MTYATSADVLARWLPVNEAPIGADDVIDLIISEVEDFIEERFTTLPARITGTTDTITVRTVRRIVVSAVIRIMKRAGDQRVSFSESANGFAASGSFAQGTVPDEVLTDAEILSLSPKKKVGAWQLSMVPTTASNPYAYGSDDGFTGCSLEIAIG